MTSRRCSASSRAARRSAAPAPRTRALPVRRARSSPPRSCRCRSWAATPRPPTTTERRHEGEAQGADLARGRPGRGRGRHGPAHAARARAARARVRPCRVCAARAAGGPRPGPDNGDRRADGRAGRGTRELTLVEPELAARVLERALARGGDMAELYAEARRGFALSLDDGRVERPQGGRERGACVRVVQGESTYYGYVDGLAEEDLLRVAESASQALHGEARAPARLEAARPARGHAIEKRPEEVAVERKSDVLRACDEHARGLASEVTQVRLGYAEGRRQVEVFGSDGRAAADDRTRVRLSAQVVARRDGRVETGGDTRGRHQGWELIEADPELVAEKAARRALTLLDAVDAPTGRLPVVVGNAFGGVLLHEAVGHGLEADAVQKRASVYAGRLGEQLGGSFVTAYDDGSRANEWGSDGIDDEGTPTQRTTVIEEGRLAGYLYDLVSARRDGVEPTGNGRRESFRHLPVPRMTNTY